MVTGGVEKFDAACGRNVRSIICTALLMRSLFAISVSRKSCHGPALRENNKAGVTLERFALSPFAFWEKVDNVQPTIAAINKGGVAGEIVLHVISAWQPRVARNYRTNGNSRRILPGAMAQWLSRQGSLAKRWNIFCVKLVSG